MGKRLGTYRVDEDLLAAVAAKAAERGETVTDLIIQRFEAYIRDDGAAGIVSSAHVEPPLVYTDVEPPADYEESPVVSCKHPAASVNELGECGICHADVW